jgi:hypothetical protein
MLIINGVTALFNKSGLASRDSPGPLKTHKPGSGILPFGSEPL